jgi:hypothetical protein
MLGPESCNQIWVSLKTVFAKECRDSVAAVLLVINNFVPFFTVGLSVNPDRYVLQFILLYFYLVA